MRSMRAVMAALIAAALAVIGLTPLTTTPASAEPEAAFSQTKTIGRYFGSEDDRGLVGDRYTVTVKADVTKQLQGRERIHITWSGAKPTAGRASNPFAENGVNQEYPVVIMQCRGRGAQVTPETCWTNSRIQRSQVGVNAADAIWTRDLFASAADRRVKSGTAEYPLAACDAGDETRYSHITRFVDAKGAIFNSCTAESMAPEAAVGASFPAADQAAFTDLNGNGSAMFEVRTDIENASLGCNYRVGCTVVVIPIMGLSCLDRADTNGAISANSNCRKGGSFVPGETNFDNRGADAAVTATYWWSESNWRNRFQIPISFGLPPSACDALDQRAPTPFFGTELLHQAAIQWAPAYCLNKSRFKWQANAMPDEAAFGLMQQGEAVAANVSGERESVGGDPVAYAPTAITGFAISYIIDKPNNAGEFTDLRLNARLIAKLLSQSYPASNLGKTHPGLESNPLALTLDPEFQKLNPGLTDNPPESAATLASLSTSSDVINTLTAYIAADKDAVAFLKGAKDPWGMRVNPFFKNTVQLPVSQWPALDTFVPKSGIECMQENEAPYLPQVAAPVQSMETISNAVLDGWPLVATKCDRASVNDPWKLGRVERQGMGSRFVIGLTTLGDAERLGLHTAKLSTSNGNFAAPDLAGLAAAIKVAKPGKPLQPWTFPQAAVRRAGDAYPGTMLVYTAARTRGMDKADAAKVAQFIEVSSTEGQIRGRGNGQLPEGYLPIRKTGVTARLWQQAQLAAKAIRAQKEAPKASTTPQGGSKPNTGNGAGDAGGPAAGLPGSAPATGDPAAAAGAPDGNAPATTAAGAPVVTAKTMPVSSRVGGLILPLLLTLGLIAGLVALAGRMSLRRQGVR